MENEQKSGFLLVNKPVDWTSFDIVGKLRGITGIRKIGHAGTLDPFATGLLIIAIGRAATKQIDNFMKLDKTYRTTFVFGATTPSLDTETEVEIDDNFNPENLTEKIDAALPDFTGTISQIPPIYSAIKKDGKRAYKSARGGEIVELDPRQVTIHEFKRLSNPIKTEHGYAVDFEIHVGSGTYIRSLSRDLAESVGTLGYTSKLERTSIEKYKLENASEIADITKDNWQDKLFEVA